MRLLCIKTFLGILMHRNVKVTTFQWSVGDKKLTSYLMQQVYERRDTKIGDQTMTDTVSLLKDQSNVWRTQV